MQDPGEEDRSGISGKKTFASNGFIMTGFCRAPRQPTGGTTAASAAVAISLVFLVRFLGRRAGGNLAVSIDINGWGLNVDGNIGAVRTKLPRQSGVFRGANEKSGVANSPPVTLPASIGTFKIVCRPRYLGIRRGLREALGSDDGFLEGIVSVSNPAKSSISVTSGIPGSFIKSEGASLLSVIVGHSRGALESVPRRVD
jgi:hypothetical protein